MKESLIHPNYLTTPVTGSSLQLFSLSELVEALLENESGLVSQPGRKGIEINQLLYFEPYSCFNAETLRELVENSSNQLVSEAFPNEASNKTFHTKVNRLKQVLDINSTKFQAALARAPPFQRDQPEYQCKLVFQVWKENTQSPTYGALRSALDKYSVFCGRNPLVSCEFVQVHTMHYHHTSGIGHSDYWTDSSMPFWMLCLYRKIVSMATAPFYHKGGRGTWDIIM